MEPRWLSDDQQRVWRSLAGLLTLLPPALDAQLQRDSGITSFSYWVLAMLSEQPDRSLRMSELAEMSRSSLSRLSHVASKLEARGWIRRERSTSDARSSWAILTEEGWEKVVEAAPGHVEAVRSLVFDALTDEQVEQLGVIAQAIFDRINGSCDEVDSERSGLLGRTG